MPRRLAPVALASLLAAPPVAAQPVTKAQPAAQVAAQPGAGVALPPGWHVQLDRADASTGGTRFVAMGSGWHATTGRASGVYYDPRTTATGAFTVEASFRQTTAPAHPEAYGLVLGATRLGTPAPDYLYYIVRGTGEYMIRHRAGAELHTLAEWTRHPAVRVQDAQGMVTNALRVVVGSDSVHFLANGTQVAAFGRVPMLNTDGVVGVRVNHGLDVHIDGPRVTPAR